MNNTVIENDIYASIIGECERLEHDNLYKGNGHHLAQRLTKLVSAALLKGNQQTIYNALTTTPMSTRAIAKAIGMPSKIVSALLKQIKDNTLLVGSKNNGRLKSWYKTDSD